MHELRMTTLIISNEKMKDIMEIVKHLGESGLLSIGVSKTIENGAKEQRDRISFILLATLGASLLGSIR